MADGKLKIREGKLLISAAAKVATADACCDCDCCPSDRASSYLLTGTLYFHDGTDLVCDDVPFMVTLTEGDACIYDGTVVTDCAVQLHFVFQMLNPTDHDVDECTWQLFEDTLTPGDPVLRAGTTILGAMPDIDWTDGTNVVSITDLVIS